MKLIRYQILAIITILLCLLFVDISSRSKDIFLLIYFVFLCPPFLFKIHKKMTKCSLYLKLNEKDLYRKYEGQKYFLDGINVLLYMQISETEIETIKDSDIRADLHVLKRITIIFPILFALGLIPLLIIIMK